MILAFVWRRQFKTVPLLPYHPKSHASRTLLHKDAIKHLYKSEQPFISNLRGRLGKSSKHLLKSSSPQFQEAVTSILSAFNDNLTPKFTLFASLWQGVKSMEDLMLGIAIMKVARFLNLPNRSVVLCEFMKAAATFECSSVRTQGSSSVLWTSMDIVAYACKERIAFLNEELLDTFAKHCKSPLDALSMLVYARDTYSVLLSAEGLNNLFLKLIECHRRKDTEHTDLIWTAITKLATCCEIKEGILMHFLADCNAEEREELLRVRLSSKHISASPFLEHFRNKASTDDLESATANDPVNKPSLDHIVDKATLDTFSIP